MTNVLRNDVMGLNGFPCDKHFQEHNQEFILEAKFTILELI